MANHKIDKFAQAIDIGSIPEPPKGWKVEQNTVPKQENIPAAPAKAEPKSNLPPGVSESGGIYVIPKGQREGDAFYQQGLVPIKSMQQSLINLSKEIASHNIQDVADRQTAKGETLTGANSFMNFLVNNYMSKAKTTGKQLVNVDEKQPVRMDTAKENDNFKGVLKTITRIGTPGQEQRPDGVWGPRTNNALKQVYSLAYALIGLLNDMGININGYSNSDLVELHEAIPESIENVSIGDKVKKAGIIEKNLNKLRALYDNFRDKVLNNQSYRSHIAQEQPLMISKKPNQQVSLNDNEKSLYEQHKSTELDITLNGRKTTVMPYNLTSIENFKKFLNSKKDALTPQELEAVNKGDQLTINKFLMEVADGLGKE